MIIHIISPGFVHQNSKALLTPLIIWNHNLKKCGFKINIYQKIDIKNEGDLVIVDSKLHRSMWLNNEKKILEDFYYLKSKYNKIIYCDTADSSGWIQSELLPIVDCYWKFQILKDKKLYLEPLYDQRLFTNYYHKNNFIVDENKDYSTKIVDPKTLEKIKVFWNSSMANFSIYSHITSRIYKYVKIDSLIKFRYNSLKTLNNKNNDIFCRFNSANYRETISYHRKTIQNLLSYFDDLKFSKVKRIKYFNELSKSKISISPFGWGEIAYRDFESFINSTILIKPDMSHLETWPNLYIDKKTYLSFNWNFDNLIDVIENALDNYQDYIELANEGFYNYIKYTYSNEAPLHFEKRFCKLINDLK